MIVHITLEQREIAVESESNASIEYAVSPLS
jgi:hypothetical protein